MENTELINLLINNKQFQITQDGETNRLTQDIFDCVKELATDYEDLSEEYGVNLEEIKEAGKHIAKLEKMLDKREIKYKDYDTTLRDGGFK